MSTGYTVLRTWTQATTADTNPSASDTFVQTDPKPPGVNSIELAFSEVTKDATTSATLALWVRTWDNSGSQQVIPWSMSVVTFNTASTSDTGGRVTFEDVPAGAWYAQVNAIDAGSFSATAFIRSYDKQER